MQSLPSRLFVATAVALAFLCSLAAHAASEPCKALRNFNLTADQIGLPTTGADVTSARHSSEGGVSFCRVMGRVHPIDPAADDIRFELNLPDNWNGKALQYGGGTFDGYLGATNGLKRTAVSLKSQPTPLERGYATFGSDSGHHHNYFPFPDAVNVLNSKFARNAEMRRNFAGDALKKVHDTAVEIVRERYGRAPRRMYFIGGSTGGREALRVAQDFPDDYDGVLAAYAAWDQVELDMQFIRTAQALYAPGGFIGPAQNRIITRAVEKACDARDGLRDGIISDPADCRVNASSFRCPDGKKHHGCLSAAQWNTLHTFATEQKTVMALSNGVDSIPGYNVLSGASLSHATGLLPFALQDPLFGLNSFGYVLGDGVTRNFLPSGHHYNSLLFDTTTGGQWHDQVISGAHELDSTDANLKPFFSHGGKLILVHGTEDNVVPTNSSVDYYERVESKLGPDATQRSVRLYVIAGLGHGYGKYAAGFDTIGTLDAWADRGIAPEGLTVTDNHSGRTRPLCEWPRWPRYNGTGDTKQAGSFTCTSSGTLQASVQ